MVCSSQLAPARARWNSSLASDHIQACTPTLVEALREPKAAGAICAPVPLAASRSCSLGLVRRTRCVAMRMHSFHRLPSGTSLLLAASLSVKIAFGMSLGRSCLQIDHVRGRLRSTSRRAQCGLQGTPQSAVRLSTRLACRRLFEMIAKSMTLPVPFSLGLQV